MLCFSLSTLSIKSPQRKSVVWNFPNHIFIKQQVVKLQTIMEPVWFGLFQHRTGKILSASLWRFSKVQTISTGKFYLLGQGTKNPPHGSISYGEEQVDLWIVWGSCTLTLFVPHKPSFSLWSAANFGWEHSLIMQFLCRQLQGVISVPFLGHWLCDAQSHWEAPHIPIPPPQEKPVTAPIKLLSTGYTHFHWIWGIHLACRCLLSHFIPRVPEDARERHKKIVFWLPARGIGG